MGCGALGAPSGLGAAEVGGDDWVGAGGAGGVELDGGAGVATGCASKTGLGAGGAAAAGWAGAAPRGAGDFLAGDFFTGRGGVRKPGRPAARPSASASCRRTAGWPESAGGAWRVGRARGLSSSSRRALPATNETPKRAAHAAATGSVRRRVMSGGRRRHVLPLELVGQVGSSSTSESPCRPGQPGACEPTRSPRRRIALRLPGWVAQFHTIDVGASTVIPCECRPGFSASATRRREHLSVFNLPGALPHQLQVWHTEPLHPRPRWRPGQLLCWSSAMVLAAVRPAQSP